MLEKLKQSQDLERFLKRYDTLILNLVLYKDVTTTPKRKLANRNHIMMK